jgi:hypothetical protein
MKQVIRVLSVLLLLLIIQINTASAQRAERYIALEGTTARAHVFNTSDNMEVASIPTGTTPGSVVIGGGGRLAFVGNINSEYVSVIDLTIQAEIKRIRPVRLADLAITSDGSTVIGVELDSGRLTLIDTTTLSVTRTIDIHDKFGGPPNPSFVLGSGNPVVLGNNVYLNTNFEIGVVDLNTGSVTLIDTPSSGDLSIAIQNLAGTLDGKFLVARRDGQPLIIVDTATNTVINTLNVGFIDCVAATTDTANPDRIFVVRALSTGAFFSVIDLNSGTILGDVPVPARFADTRTQIVLNAAGTRAYVGATTSNPNVVVIDTGAAVTNPTAAIISQFTVGVQIRGATIGVTETQPPPTAPIATAVTPALVRNDIGGVVQISGSGFAPDAQVRFGSLDPIAAQVISPSQLQVTLPANVVAQGAAVLVTNPTLSAGTASAQQSGILRNAFVIASPPTFQPVNQVGIMNFAESTLSVLNVSTNTTLAPSITAGARASDLAITPDGARAFIGHIFSPASVDVYNFVTNSVEAHIQLNSALVGVESQIRGIVLAPRFSTGTLAAYVVSSHPVAPGLFALDLYVIGADPAGPDFETIVATIPTGAPDPGPNSGSLAVTPDGHYAFIQGFQIGLSDVNLISLDLSTGASGIILGSTFGFTGFQPALELTPDGKYLLATADDGRIQVLDVFSHPLAPALMTTLGTVPPSGAALTPRVVGNILYAFDPFRNLVDIFNFNPAVNDFAELGNFTIPGTPTIFGIAFDVTPDGKLLYAVMKEEDSVAVIDTAKVIAHDPSALITKIGTGIGPQMAAVRPGTPTPAGSNVPVHPIPEVVINFSSVTAAGATSTTTTNTNPDPTPAGFSLGTPPVFYEISSTAVFTGTIQVCISYNPAQFIGSESNIRLLHDEGGSFVDVTTTHDTVNHVICGQVTHFSAFTIGVTNLDFFFDSLLAEINSGVLDQGLQNSLSAKIRVARASFDRGLNQVSVNQLNAFENEVRAQSGKHLSSIEAMKILHMTNEIISLEE